MVALSVGASLVLGLAAGCGSSSGDEATPGYDASVTGVDESPFELAKPTTTEGPTTIPGEPAPARAVTPDDGQGAEEGSDDAPAEGDGGGGPSSGQPSPAAPWLATTTTTTTPISEPALYVPVQIQSLCGMTRALQSFGLILTTPGLNLVEYVGLVRQNLQRYAEVSPPNLRATVDTINGTINRIVDVGAASGYSTSDPTFQKAIFDAAQGTGDYAGFPAQVDIIYRHEQAQC